MDLVYRTIHFSVMLAFKVVVAVNLQKIQLWPIISLLVIERLTPNLVVSWSTSYITAFDDSRMKLRVVSSQFLKINMKGTLYKIKLFCHN